jgi:hypothetical protein
VNYHKATLARSINGRAMAINSAELLTFSTIAKQPERRAIMRDDL